MTVALLGIGTELSRGDVTNTNGAWLARELTELGFEVAAIDVVDDDEERIIDALLRLSAKHELAFCTGGLGPTTDDITTECVAAALRTSLELHPPSLRAIEERLARFGRAMSASNEKQAYFPKGATVIPNDWGTAPGFSVRVNDCKIYFLPGVPSEMTEIFRHRILPDLAAPRHRTPFELVLRTVCEGESVINDRLSDVEATFDVTLGYRTRFPEVDVKILTKDVDLERARERAERAKAAVCERLSDCVYGAGTDTLPSRLGDELSARGLSLALAESCTGGLAASLITRCPGVSSWFDGSIVSYANEVKSRVLGVATHLIETHGAVSSEVAEAMVNGVCRATGSPCGLAITGIAGPSGGTPAKPVGTVWFGLRDPSGTRSFREVFAGDRLRIQQLAAHFGLKRLLDALRALPRQTGDT
ncbi:MAG: CinA family nicotinamide mononucleotide deamidase-related protein [Polyangiaceae bacterium]